MIFACEADMQKAPQFMESGLSNLLVLDLHMILIHILTDNLEAQS